MNLHVPPGAQPEQRLAELRTLVPDAEGRSEEATKLLGSRNWNLMNILPNQARQIDEGPVVYVFGRIV